MDNREDSLLWIGSTLPSRVQSDHHHSHACMRAYMDGSMDEMRTTWEWTSSTVGEMRMDVKICQDKTMEVAKREEGVLVLVRAPQQKK